MIAIDDTGVLAGLDELLLRLPLQAERGLQKQAAIAEGEMQSTTAHGDITGATRASYRAFVIGGAHDGSAESASGYAAAEAAIAGHPNPYGGAALSQDSGVVLGPDERGVMITSYTDYQSQLEMSGKAVLGPTLQEFMFAFTQAVASEGL